MHFAIQNSFPNHSVSAEKEFIARFRLIGEDLGWQITEVVTSDDILLCAPDAVLVTHDFTPKLTHIPTIGVIWSPTDYSTSDPQRMRNILSYDGCLVATPWLRDWTEALFRKHDKSAPISSFNFLPTAIAQESRMLPEEPVLFYAGVHWDGSRHGDVFKELEGRCPMRIYGKPERWEGRSNNYVGLIPFDGTGVVDAIAECGISLALHTDNHLRANVPSMRLFEAAAAGAVIIADQMPFAQFHFGDSVLWVDTSQKPTHVAAQITSHVQWVIDNRQSAQELAQRSQKIFREKFDLRKQVEVLPEFVNLVKKSMSSPMSAMASGSLAERQPLVEVMVRVGSRPVEIVARSLRSLAAQGYQNIGLIIVKFRDVDGLEELLAEHNDRFTQIRVIDVPDDGMRSAAFWAGIKAVRGTYFCNLDDDDTIHPTHIEQLVRVLESASEEVPMAYTGGIQVQEDDGHWFDQPNFHGDQNNIICERRQLRFMEEFSIERMVKFDNFILSHAWLARRSALKADVLEDPGLRVGEDVYLYLMLMRQGPLKFVPTASAEWHWRSNSRDNSMFLTDIFAEDGPKNIERLLANHALPSFTSETIDHVETRKARSKFEQILRKPSLLLGSYAPAWRRFRRRMRNGR